MLDKLRSAPLHTIRARLAERLRPIGDVKVNKYLVRFEEPGTNRELTVFPDGRAIVKGTEDPGEARRLYARYIGV